MDIIQEEIKYFQANTIALTSDHVSSAKQNARNKCTASTRRCQIKALVVLEERKAFSFLTCIKKYGIYAKLFMIQGLRIHFTHFTQNQQDKFFYPLQFLNFEF